MHSYRSWHKCQENSYYLYFRRRVNNSSVRYSMKQSLQLKEPVNPAIRRALAGKHRPQLILTHLRVEQLRLISELLLLSPTSVREQFVALQVEVRTINEVINLLQYGERNTSLTSAERSGAIFSASTRIDSAD